MCPSPKAPAVQQTQAQVIPDNKAPDDGDAASTRDRVGRRASTKTSFTGPRGLESMLYGKTKLGE